MTWITIGHSGPMCRALILDMDGLMVDTESVERRAWKRAASDFDCTISDDDFALLVGRAEADSERILRGIWANRGEPADAFDRIHERKEAYLEGEAVVEKEGATALLRRAAELRVPVAVASSSIRSKVFHRLSAAGLLDAGPEIVVGADEVVQGKPAPDLFLKAAQRLKVEPGACVVVEDSDSGVAAATAAGMIPILVPDQAIRRADPPAEVVAMAHLVCSSLAQVATLLTASPATSVHD